ncbi:MAG: InlB B-repeat-containing protein [Chloroflexota bacterium]
MRRQLAAFVSRRYSVAMQLTRYSGSICAALLAFLIGFSPLIPGPVAMAADYPLDENSGVIDDAVDYLLQEQASDGSIGGFAISAWVVMALAAADVDPSGCAVDSGDSIVEYLESEVDTSGFDATDWARMILAIVAAGEDPGDFGGEDYIAGLEDLYEIDGDTGYLQIGEPDMLNDDFWGVLALLAAEENVDPDIVDFIYEHQGTDGGWAWFVGEESDVDDTAAAILALIAAGEDEDSDEIQSALDFLESVQNSDGGFPQYEGDESNSASDAWAIMAITAAGDDPNSSYWEEGGDTPVDHLLSLQHSDGHFQFADGDDIDGIWNTAYAIPALLGERYPVSAVPLDDEDDDSPLDNHADDPEIGFSPDEFEFEAEEGGDDPDEQTLEIWNDGDGELEWLVTSSADWLSLLPDDGTSTGEDDEVEVSVDIDGLDEGEYTARITITASGTGTERVDVTLIVEGADDEDDEDQDGDDILILNTLTVPPSAGTITRSVPSGSQGYAEGTTVQLTAVPSKGYAFTGWAGDASGTENPVTVTMSSDLNVTAYFVRFDAEGVSNVSLTYASPEMALVSVVPYPVQSIPSNPKGFKLTSAYLVEPQGTGSFTLRFDGLTDAENVGVFKVVNGAWTQLPRAVVAPTAIEVTLPDEDPVLALARAGGGLNVIGRLQALFGSVDPVILAVIIAVVVVAAFVLVALLTVRGRGGDYYY